MKNYLNNLWLAIKGQTINYSTDTINVKIDGANVLNVTVGTASNFSCLSAIGKICRAGPVDVFYIKGKKATIE